MFNEKTSEKDQEDKDDDQWDQVLEDPENQKTLNLLVEQIKEKAQEDAYLQDYSLQNKSKEA